MYFFPHGSTAVVNPGLLYEVLRSHSDTSHPAGLRWTSDRPVAETSTEQQQNTQKRKTHSTGFEPAISASERPYTHALDRAATGIGH
jgi:hypothetical protein